MERGTAAEGDVVAARREHILEIARSAGSVAVEDLAERLGVTPQTIRKDLNVLAGQSLLSRIHGGALVTSGVDNLAMTHVGLSHRMRRLVLGQQLPR